MTQRILILDKKDGDGGAERRLYTLHGPLETAAAIAGGTMRDRLPFSRKRKKPKQLAQGDIS